LSGVPKASSSAPADGFGSGGEMGKAIRAFDWARTPLGSMEAWPQSLRTAVSICLGSRFPMMLWWGPDLTNIYNDAFVSVLGGWHPHALGMSGRDVWTDTWPVIGPQVAKVMEEGGSTLNERVRLVYTRHGYPEETWFTWSFGPIYDETGRVAGLFNRCHEDTAAVRAEQERDRLLAELGNERTRLAEVIGRAPAFICTLRGPDHVFEFANERYYEVAGRRDIIGKAVRDVQPEVEAQGYLAILDRVYRTGEPFEAREMPLVLRHGDANAPDRRVINVAWQALREADGTVSGVFIHGVDVTEAVRSREALREANARYRALFDSIDDGFCVFEVLLDAAGRPADYRFVEVNPAFERITGIADAPGRRMREIAPAHEEHWFETYGRVAATGEPVRFQNTAAALGGRTYDLYAFRAGRPEQRRVAVLFRDITEQRRAEAERQALLERERAARTDADAANRAKDRFLAVLSHELRTPLTPVAMAATAMEMDAGLPSEFRDDVAMIRRNVELETRLIDDLLDLSRVTPGKLRLDRQPTRVHEVIGHVLVTVGPEPPVAGPGRADTPLRLLLVEDHADTVRTLARLLRLDGYTVRTAHSVAEALSLATAEPFDLLVSDIGLPDASGLDLMRAVRRDRAVPGIAMSGYGMEDDVRASRAAGFAEHLVKPVNVPQLRAAIRRVAGVAR